MCWIFASSIPITLNKHVSLVNFSKAVGFPIDKHRNLLDNRLIGVCR